MSEVTEEETETISHGYRTENDATLSKVNLVLKMEVTVIDVTAKLFQ